MCLPAKMVFPAACGGAPWPSHTHTHTHSHKCVHAHTHKHTHIYMDCRAGRASGVQALSTFEHQTFESMGSHTCPTLLPFVMEDNRFYGESGGRVLIGLTSLKCVLRSMHTHTHTLRFTQKRPVNTLECKQAHTPHMCTEALM